MTRRIVLVLVLLLAFASLASAKLKPEDTEYFDEKFQGVLTEIQQLKAQLDALSGQLKQISQNESELQQSLSRQTDLLRDVDHMLSSLRASSEDNFSALKATVLQLQNDQQKSLQAISALASQITAAQQQQQQQQQQATSASAAKPAAATVRAYITIAEKGAATVTVSMGSDQGLHAGSKLALYKSSDNTLATRVGVLEVTDVIDNGNSHAKVVTLSEGAQPEFGDIVVRVGD